MKPTKMKSSGELEEYIAELKEQLKQAKLDKREALAREQKQAREWRTDLAHTLGETVLTVTGCDWTRLDLEALREWLVDHAGEMQTLLVGPERTPEEAHDALIAFRRGQAAEAKQERACGAGGVAPPAGGCASRRADGAGEQHGGFRYGRWRHGHPHHGFRDG